MKNAFFNFLGNITSMYDNLVPEKRLHHQNGHNQTMLFHKNVQEKKLKPWNQSKFDYDDKFVIQIKKISRFQANRFLHS